MRVAVTGVTAGQGLTGGGTSGNVTLNVGAGAGIQGDADTVSIATGGVTAGMLQDSAAVKKLNDLTGNVTLVAGSNVTITSSGQNLTISATPGGGGGDITSSIAAWRMRHGEFVPPLRGRPPEERDGKRWMGRRPRSEVGQTLYARRTVVVSRWMGQFEGCGFGRLLPGGGAKATAE